MSNVVPINDTNLPAPSKLTAFRKDMQRANAIVSRLREVCYSPVVPACIDLERIEREVIATAEKFIADGDLARIRKALEAASRPATRKEIAEQVTIFVGCILSTLGRDMTVFARMMAQDIGERSPSVFALEYALSKLRREMDQWGAPISVVLDELSSAEGMRKDWCESLSGDVPKLIADTKAMIAKARRKIEPLAAACDAKSIPASTSTSCRL